MPAKVNVNVTDIFCKHKHKYVVYFNCHLKHITFIIFLLSIKQILYAIVDDDKYVSKIDVEKTATVEPFFFSIVLLWNLLINTTLGVK